MAQDRLGPCESPPTRPAAALGIATRIARLAVIGCVVWMGWSTATTLSEVCRGPKPSQAPAAEQPRAETTPLEWLSSAEGGQWRFAGTPLGHRFRDPSGLLGMPAGTERLCDRRDLKGRLLAEVLSVEGDWASLRQLWQSEGWSVETSLEGDRGVVAVCRREQRAVQILARPAVGRPRRMFVVLVGMSA